jgi:hypothetical protein
MNRRQPRRLADFGPLKPAEAKLLAELDSGQFCVIGEGPDGGERGRDLESCAIRGCIRVWNCLFPDRVWMEGATVATLDRTGSHLMKGPHGDGLQTGPVSF